MPRLARVVIPRYPHHVTQRGSRRQKTFFSDQDYRRYTELLVRAKQKAGVEVWAYCLMPNHVHLVVVPEYKESLVRFLSDAHRRYARQVNLREGWRGHLWQERFHSFVMDEEYLIATVRYTERNPVRARLCSRPEDWRWSSVHAHLTGEDDGLVTVKPMLERIPDWLGYVTTRAEDAQTDVIRKHAKTGRPVGDDEFMGKLESLTGRRLKKRKPGPRRDK